MSGDPNKKRSDYKYQRFEDYAYDVTENIVEVCKRRLAGVRNSYEISRLVCFIQFLNLFAICLLIYSVADRLLSPFIHDFESARHGTAIIVTFLLCGFWAAIDHELLGWHVLFEFAGFVSICILIVLVMTNVFVYFLFIQPPSQTGVKPGAKT